MSRPWTACLLLAWAIGLVPARLAAAEIPVEIGKLEGAIEARRDGEAITLRWPAGKGRQGRIEFDLREGKPLFRSLGLVLDTREIRLLSDVHPVTFVTVGSRENPPGRPEGMSVFNVFFDSPAKRPHQTHAARLKPTSARVSGGPTRATVRIEGLSAGPFQGAIEVSVYEGVPLVHVESVLTTTEPKRAFVYDAGLVADNPGWTGLAWRDTEGTVRYEPERPRTPDRALAVRHRAVAVATPGGSIACFPPPHQFFYPRDLTDNQSTIWAGLNHRGIEPRSGFGVRQTETGGGNFVPWFNAPPGTPQRMGVFYLLTNGPPILALDEALTFTRGDRYAEVPGYLTFSSHWHMAIAVAAMKEIAQGKKRTTPDFVAMFKDMNVRIVHLAEFHGDGHPQDPGPLRLPEMKAMFDECRRLSDAQLLLLPGEEANVHFGVARPGQHPGHWLYLFPRPVYWTMQRQPEQRRTEDIPPYGPVHHVGTAGEMQDLIESVGGLAWTAHPRIKASNFAPDAYRDAPSFRSSSWLGGAWKAMPADLSRPRLGERVLDLLDDMANWGARKYVPGEVDVFKIDHTHELYGHMNVNYLRLEKAPKYDDDWTPVLDALRKGRFFVTTGEVLLTDFTVGGKASGETLVLAKAKQPEIKARLQWTFPLRQAELVMGDGEKVYRDTLDLSATGPFQSLEWGLAPDLKGMRWVRLEVWDVAGNGAFTQPVWIEP